MAFMVRATAAAACVAALGIAAAAQAPATEWRQEAHLTPSNPGMAYHYGDGGSLPGHNGHSVAVSRDGSTIAVGAPHESSAATGINGNQKDDSAYEAGAVYVYTRRGNAWVQQAYVKASNTGKGDYFGSSVALSRDGNTMIVAAPFESSAATGVNGNQQDDSLPQAGAVYVFVRNGTTWRQQAYLKASNTGRPGKGDDFGDGDTFGFAITVSDDGNTVAVGAVSEDSVARGAQSDQQDDSFSSAGAVYVFARTGTAWAQQAFLKADASTNMGLGDQFGYGLSMSADGNTLAVGVYDESGSGRAVNAPVDRMRGGSGAAYIFRRTGSAWSKESYLKVWNADNGDSWGAEVALSGDGNTLAVGGLDDDCLCPGIHTDPKVGAEDWKSDTSVGAVAVFVRGGGTWRQQAYIKASNPSAGDQYGIRLALNNDGTTLVVGAQMEDGTTQGNSGPQDDKATESGAVYIYTRTGDAWTQRAYRKGSATQAFDEFGSSLSLSGDGTVLAVGARGEDAGPNRSIMESGGAYVFRR